jgi:hypothetical protein
MEMVRDQDSMNTCKKTYIIIVWVTLWTFWVVSHSNHGSIHTATLQMQAINVNESWFLRQK